MKDMKPSISDSQTLTRIISIYEAFREIREVKRPTERSNPTVSITVDGEVVDTKRQYLLTRAKLSLSERPKNSYTDGKHGLSVNMILGDCMQALADDAKKIRSILG